MSPSIPQADLESFASHLASSTRILALLGAGLSAASGLPTFRGKGGLWRSHDAMSLATPEAFDANPGLVWQFYSYRRHMALQAKPNPAHFALAELARRKNGFLTLSQNVDGLSQRAGHPPGQLHLLHGSLFDVKCELDCGYVEHDNFTDPIFPALGIPHESFKFEPSRTDKTGEEATQAVSYALQHANPTSSASKEMDISDDRVEIPQLQREDLPRCPHCSNGLLRPGVVWFGEELSKTTTGAIRDFIQESERIDLILVIGTSAQVYPAASYIDWARRKGARVAVVNMDRADTPGGENGLAKGDWFFEGDAGIIVPQILSPK